MLALARVGLVAALAVLAPVFVTSSPADAADKAFARPELADAGIRLEAQIKKDAGSVGKPLAQLRREADAAFQRNDVRSGMVLVGQIVAVAPQEAANWLRLARAVRGLKPANDRERNVLLERAAAAAYIAYQRAGNRGEEAESLVILGQTFGDRRIWRPALDALRFSLELREEADVRVLYERMRETHGFRLLDYSVDADAASPRACFQFSEELPGKRTDFSPFVAVAGMDRPALSSEEKQLCVEGLKHGERYSVTLRAGLPSTVKETLAKSVEMSVYVRDRKPFARFSSRAYVLPRTGQRGIPVISVNTDAVTVAIYRVGDRSLLDTVLGRDFQRSLSRYEINRLADTRAARVWSGELAVELRLNAEVTTAFPVDRAVGDMAPGVYLMTADAKGADPDDYSAIASQWFVVSDLGIAAYSGSDGINVSVHSLATTEPKGQIEVRLMSRGNEVLATKRTDAQGRVQFEAGLARGEGAMAPAMLVASEARGDYGFLNLRSPAFDLTDRGVSGRVAPAGLDAFVYTERGVYRSGETVHITALLRDPQGVAALNVPVTLIVERPDGLEYRRVTVPDQGLGGRSLSVAINAAATTGTWRVRAHADPKRPAIGEATFLVEDYVPDRLEFEIAAPAGRIARDAPAELTVDGRYLYGAPASELNLEGELLIAPARERPNFAGYRFGIADEDVTAERQPLSDLPQTDAQGKARFEVKLDKVPETTRPLEATVIVRMAEAGGRAVERKLTLPVTPAANMIGVRPMFSGRSLGEGETANFDVVMASPDGKTLAANGLRYELLKVEQRYQWYRRGGSWGYESIKLTRRIADGRIDAAADKPGRIALPVQWGRYRLDVSTGEPNGPLTSVAFDAGWYTEASADTPDMLEIALDKPEYLAGEAMTVAVTGRTAGRVTLNVMGEKLLHTMTQDVQPGTARIRLNVGRDWGTGAYVVATLRRPLDQRAQRMPGRAIGVQWFAIDRKAHTLALDMTLPNLQRPNSALRVPVKIGGLASGEDARIVVAAVDVGILNLTNYKPPAPDEHYLGQKRLGSEIRDLYGQLIDGMQGTVGQIRTGGDGPGGELASPPSQKPLALYSGIVTVKSDGTAEVNFDIPAFAGTVRVMAVAWSRNKVGRASGDLTVRDPVVLTATLPRFLLTGDRSSMHIDLDNVEGPAGDYRVLVRSGGIVALGEGMSSTLTLRAKQRGSATVPLTASAVGTADLTVRVTGPGGFSLERSYALAVKPSTQVLTRRTVRTLARNEALTLSNDLFADLVPGTGSVAVSVGPSTALDAATLLRALDRYPFGCSEQIVSRALPLLYVNELAAEAHLALDSAVDQRIRDAIERVLARQSSNGSFGLWGLGGGDAWLDAYVTDFLTRARERDFPIPEQGFNLALERLRNVVATAPEPAKDGGRNLAYALYVLARNGVAPLGDLRYLADAKLSDLATPIAKAQVAAALGLLGDRTRAERVYQAALADIAPKTEPELFSRIDYGSTLRDAAALVTLAAEAGGPRPVLTAAVQRIEQARSGATHTSTQENAWLVLAARALAKDGGGSVSLNVAGAAHRGALYRTVRASALGQPLRVANAGEAPVQAVVSVSGAPTVPEPAAENGFKIERQFYTLDGDEADPAKAKQNQRFVVVLKVTEPEPQYGRVLIADYLPAGFEIDNPRLVSSGDTGTLSWISDAAEPEHSEFRDDRFTAAFNRHSRSPVAFSVAYVVRAVAPGRYVLPQAYIEDMYRPDRFGRTETGSIEVTAK